MHPIKSGLSAAISALIAVLIACISTGHIRIPLPAPAHGKFVNIVPQGVLPWKPQPLKGPYEPNTRLLHAVRLFEGQVQGAESVTFFTSGNIALLDKFNNLYEAYLENGCGNGRGSSTVGDGVAAAGDESSSVESNDSISFVLNPEPIARLGQGRPLGYHIDHEENVVVCDSLKGLVKYDTSTQEVLLIANRVSHMSSIDPNTEITYANDLAIASDAMIYFTSCSDIVPTRNGQGFYDTFKAWMLGMAQGLPRGRLLMYDTSIRETFVLAKGFYYANGVALSRDEDFLVIAETDRIRLVKYWLKGPKAGTTEPLLENLPGAPDGVSTASDGNFWVALVSPIPAIAKLLKDPTMRALYAWLPSWARPAVKQWGAVLKVSPEGKVLDFLMDPSGSHISTVSSAIEHDGCLFMGNLAGDYISYVDLGENEAGSNHCMCTCECGKEKVHTRLRLLPGPGQQQLHQQEMHLDQMQQEEMEQDQMQQEEMEQVQEHIQQEAGQEVQQQEEDMGAAEPPALSSLQNEAAAQEQEL